MASEQTEKRDELGMSEATERALLNGIIPGADGKVQMKAADYVHSMAKLRHMALALQDGWKDLAKQAKNIAEILDESEGEGAGAQRHEMMLFPDAHRADHTTTRQTVARMTLAHAVAAGITAAYDCHWSNVEDMALALLGELHKLRQPAENDEAAA